MDKNLDSANQAVRSDAKEKTDAKNANKEDEDKDEKEKEQKEGDTDRNKEKRYRRKSTITMTASSTHEIQNSISFVEKTLPDKAKSASADELSTTDKKETKKRLISRINIFVVARAVHRVGSAGDMIRADDPPNCKAVSVPTSASGIEQDVLQSGIAILSGKLIFGSQFRTFG